MIFEVTLTYSSKVTREVDAKDLNEAVAKAKMAGVEGEESQFIRNAQELPLEPEIKVSKKQYPDIVKKRELGDFSVKQRRKK